MESLFDAAGRGDTALVKALLTPEAPLLLFEGKSLISRALDHWSMDTVKVLIEAGVMMLYEEETRVLHKASECIPKPGVVRALLSSPACSLARLPDYDTYTIPVENHSHEIVDVIAEYGFKPTRPTLSIALRKCSVSMVRKLISLGVPVDNRAVYEAAAYVRERPYWDDVLVDILKLLLSTEGVDASYTDPNGGDTVFHAAAVSLDPKTVPLLMCSGANINQPNACGCLPTERALASPRPSMLKCMLQHGGQLRPANAYGITPLMTACAKPKHALKFVKVLFEFTTPDINAKGFNGMTALSEARRCGNTDVVKFLLDRGAIE